MTDLLNVYDTTLQKTAVVQNAFNIVEEQTLNNIYTLAFSLPADDAKVEKIQPFHFVRFGDGQMYRIISMNLQDNDISILTVTCEHAIATLCDNVMFGSFTYNGSLDGTSGNTANAIRWVLSQQTVKNWSLGECEFDYLYEYNWEQENLLNAMYSIPKEFTQPYKWTFDTSSYPWKVNLLRIHTASEPEYYIRSRHNLLDAAVSKDYADVCTRLYPLGYGEGINQLTIREANDDVPYLEAPAKVITKYGRKEKILVDRSFENAETLKAYVQRVLDSLQTPGTSRSFNVVDLYPITSRDIDNAEVGKICRLTKDNTTVYITKTRRTLDAAGDLQIELSDKSTDVVSKIADLADRVRIESVYAQGATQIYQHSKDANAGTTLAQGHVISLYFPSEMKQINKVLLRLKLKKFRSYSQTTAGGGGISSTSEYIGTGSANLGGTSEANWGATSENIPTGNNINNSDGTHWHVTPRSWFYHTHGVGSISDSGHKHNISLPDHTHSITPGIFENSASPSSFRIYVGSAQKASISGTSYNADITEYLLNASGLIPRNTWIDVTIVPNTLAYVISSVFVQGFVQSRGGGNY